MANKTITGAVNKDSTSTHNQELTTRLNCASSSYQEIVPTTKSAVLLTAIKSSVKNNKCRIVNQTKITIVITIIQSFNQIMETITKTSNSKICQ